MNRKSMSVAFSLPLAFLLGSAWPGQRTEDPLAAVGVVDMDRVAKAYEKNIRLVKELNRSFAEFHDRLNERFKEIEGKLKANIDAFDPYTPEWVEANVKYRSALSGLEEERKLGNARLNRQRFRQKVEIYEDIERAIAKVAKARGVRLVLRWRAMLEKAPLDQQFQVHSSRDLLYYDRALDLTETVIRMLKAPSESTQGGK